MVRDLVPHTQGECLDAARRLVLAGLVSEQERDEATNRARAYGCEVREALEAAFFARILAGATRGIDPATSLRLFVIYGGALSIVREGPLALARQSGQLAAMIERVLVLDALQRLEDIDTAVEWARDRGEAEPEQLGRRLSEKVADRLRQLEIGGRADGDGYEAAVCCVRRGSAWHVEIRDIDHAREAGLLGSEWWATRRIEALTYSARQPLLRQVFGDILAGLATEDEMHRTQPPAAAIPPETPPEDDEDGLREGVRAA